MLRQGVLNWPVSCCCPSRPLWCSHWRPRPLLWGRWTGRCLRRSNQTSAKTPLLCWTPALLLWHGDNNVKWLTKQINWRMDLLIKCSLLNAKKEKSPSHQPPFIGLNSGLIRFSFRLWYLWYFPCSDIALTFTEWLWKSVTMISLLLLTAAKWGP